MLCIFFPQRTTPARGEHYFSVDDAADCARVLKQPHVILLVPWDIAFCVVQGCFLLLGRRLAMFSVVFVIISVPHTPAMVRYMAPQTHTCHISIMGVVGCHVTHTVFIHSLTGM